MPAALFVFSQSAYAQHIPGENYPDQYTLGLWHMNDSTGSSALDSGDSSHPGTAYGTTIVAGRFGRARLFADQPSYIDLGPQLLGGPPAGWSIEAWINISAWPTAQGMIFYDGSDGEVEVGVDSDSTLFFTVHTGSGWYQLKNILIALSSCI